MNKKIQLKKISIDAVLVLQGEVEHFHKHTCEQYDFFTRIVMMDISFKLWYLLRNRHEAATKSEISFSIRPGEAAVIIKCILENFRHRHPYQRNALEQIKTSIDQQLKSLI